MSDIIVAEAKRCKLFLDGMKAFVRPTHRRNVKLGLLDKMSDGQALASDWYLVGGDVREAMTRYGRGTFKL